MEIQNLLETEDFHVSFQLVLDGSGWQQYLKTSSAAIQKQQNIPGYRVGKAPLNLVAKAAGNLLFEDAANAAAPALVNQFCLEHDFSPVTSPEISVVQSDMDCLRIACSFINYPHIEKLNYRGLSAEKPHRSCTDADIDDAIEHYMGQNLYVHEVDREARIGDIAEVSFTGTCEGKRFPFDYSNGARFELGSGQLFAGLDEALIGHSAGEDFNLSLTMPEDFHREVLRGRTVDLSVHLNSVSARDRLECTEEYVKEHIKNCETLADFREYHRNRLQANYDEAGERVFSKRLEQALASSVQCPIPETMIAVATRRYETQLDILAGSEGISIEKLLQREGKTLEQFHQQVRPFAEQQVRLSIALDFIARKEEIQIQQDEIDSYFRDLANVQGISVEMVRQREGGDEGAIERLLNHHAMQIVRDNATQIMVEVDKIPEE